MLKKNLKLFKLNTISGVINTYTNTTYPWLVAMNVYCLHFANAKYPANTTHPWLWTFTVYILRMQYTPDCECLPFTFDKCSTRVPGLLKDELVQMTIGGGQFVISHEGWNPHKAGESYLNSVN